MALPPTPTIDRVALVRLRLQQHKCPGCGGHPSGKRVCCRTCTAAGLRYCPCCEQIKPLFTHSHCPDCDAADQRARYQADLEASRAALRARRRAQAAQAGRAIEGRAERRARERHLARTTARRWALGEDAAQIAAELGISPRALWQRWGRVRRAAGVPAMRGKHWR